jgi:hypothetical protein
MSTPIISKDLVEFLERLFPDRCPEVSASERAIWTAVGAAGVVRYLRSEMEQQQEEILSP